MEICPPSTPILNQSEGHMNWVAWKVLVGKSGFDEKWLYKEVWLGSFRAPGQRA